jgi:hypothetical protein
MAIVNGPIATFVNLFFLLPSERGYLPRRLRRDRPPACVAAWHGGEADSFATRSRGTWRGDHGKVQQRSAEAAQVGPKLFNEP